MKIETEIQYTKLNGKRAKYNIYEVNGTKITVDETETLLEEKYRPRKIFDLIITNELSKQLQGYIDNKNLPHLLLYSQAGGTGKTSISQVLSVETGWDSLTISSNIDRGLSVVKDKVVGFAQNLSMYGEPKLIAIEEIGDSTTAQTDSFKSVIDIYGKNCRLIITTNSMAKISQPLKTRFTIIDFNKIPESSHNEVYMKIFNRLKAILTIENVQHSDNDIAVLMKKYGFSYRELIHSLGECIKDDVLVISRLMDKDISSLSDILGLVNKKDITTIAKTAGSINHIQILEELSESYLDSIEDIMMIQPFIIHFNTAQQEISSVAFPDISFVAFCINLVKDGIRFKV